ncbi:MAG TPA: glycosyltransferase [Candidatus Portnoybacteria bacterium]|nr:glycosyltransferase [Candidatus Portnoybacteria bacterium]
MWAKNKIDSRINKDYLRVVKEVFLFIKIELIKLFKIKKFSKNNSSNDILIVNPCLIGEAMASIPAIRSFIKKQGSVDIIVSPAQKQIFKKIIGVRNVYTAKSNYQRKTKNNFIEDNQIILKKYDKIIILRINKNSYQIIKNIEAKEIQTPLKHFILYGIHLCKSALFEKIPKQWKNFNFELLNAKDKEEVDFDEIFKFDKQDIKKINELKELKVNQRIILLHLLSHWPMKNWKTKNWIKLLKKIKNHYPNSRLIFIGDLDNRKIVDIIKSQLNFNVYSLVGKTNLKDLLLIIRKSDYFIGVDSGPANMAYLTKTKSITLLGLEPYMYLPNNTGLVIGRSKKRGLLQVLFLEKNNLVNEIEVEEVFDCFNGLVKESIIVDDFLPKYFSIIIPAHNEEKIIGETLMHLKNLNYPKNKYEVVIVENGSTDKTYEISKSFESKNFKVVHSNQKGVSMARNLGIKNISKESQWVIFLDADTLLKPKFLNKLNEYLNTHPWVTYGTTTITPSSNTLKHKLLHTILINGGDFLFKYLHRIHIVNRDHLNRVKYNEKIISTEDLLFSKDLARDGGKYFFLRTSDVVSSTRRWDKKGYIKPYLLSCYHAFLGIFNKNKLKKQKWKVIR